MSQCIGIQGSLDPWAPGGGLDRPHYCLGTEKNKYGGSEKDKSAQIKMKMRSIIIIKITIPYLCACDHTSQGSHRQEERGAQINCLLGRTLSGAVPSAKLPRSPCHTPILNLHPKPRPKWATEEYIAEDRSTQKFAHSRALEKSPQQESGSKDSA